MIVAVKQSLGDVLSDRIEVGVIGHTDELVRINCAHSDVLIIGLVDNNITRKKYPEIEFVFESLIGELRVTSARMQY